MALSIGKLSLLIGAGVVGSVFAKEGRIPGFSDVISGALKIALKPFEQNDLVPSSSKPRNDALIAQVNNLRQELQLLASNSPVTVVNSAGTGHRRFGVIIVIVALGSGYVWWKCEFHFRLLEGLRCDNLSSKLRPQDALCDGLTSKLRPQGAPHVLVQTPDHKIVLQYGHVDYLDHRDGWKLPDFMFATKRGLKDACNSVANELDNLFHSVNLTKNNIAVTLDESSCRYDDIVACTATAKDEVADVRGRVSKFNADIQFVNDQIRTLESKMGKIQAKQDVTKDGVARLLLCTLDADDRLTAEPSSIASRPALEHPRVANSSRTVSLPAALPLELPSPSASSGSSETNGQSHLRSAVSASGIKDSQKNPGAAADSTFSPGVSNRKIASDTTEKLPNPNLSPRQPIRSPGILSRTISATMNFKFT